MKSVSTRSRTARLSRSASSWAARNPNGSRGREFDKVDPRAGRLGVILLPVLLVQVGYLQDPTAVISALGQKQTCALARAHVRFTPNSKVEVKTAEQRFVHCNPPVCSGLSG